MSITLTAEPAFGSEEANAKGVVMLGRNRDPLSAIERRVLADQEQIIQDRVVGFWEVGYALMEIRNRRLWRMGYSSFSDYCKRRWGFTPERASHHTQAAEVIRVLTTGKLEPLPENERQVRPLVPLLKVETHGLKELKGVAQQSELSRRKTEAHGLVMDAYRKAIEISGNGKIPSGAQVAKAVMIVKPGAASTNRSPSPSEELPEGFQDKFDTAWCRFWQSFTDFEREVIGPLVRKRLRESKSWEPTEKAADQP